VNLGIFDGGGMSYCTGTECEPETLYVGAH